MNLAEFKEYVAAFRDGTEGVRHTSSGACPGCADCGLSEDCTEAERELAGEASFSWHACDFCRRPLGGDREPAHGVVDGKLCHFSICCDCVYFLEYGKLDDSTMLDLETESGMTAQQIDAATREILNRPRRDHAPNGTLATESAK